MKEEGEDKVDKCPDLLNEHSMCYSWCLRFDRTDFMKGKTTKHTLQTPKSQFHKRELDFSYLWNVLRISGLQAAHFGKYDGKYISKDFAKYFIKYANCELESFKPELKRTNLEFTVVDLKSKNDHRIEFIESCRMVPASFFWSCFVLIILVDWPFLLWMWMSTHHIRYLLANMNSFIKF